MHGLSRRSFLASAVAATATTALPAQAQTPSILIGQPYVPPASVYAHGVSSAPFRIECRAPSLLAGTVHLYRYQSGEEIPLFGVPAVPPDQSEISRGLMVGRVTGIEQRPSWCPTPNMRAQNRSLRCYAGGERGNPMGQVAKFTISGFGYRRLHSYSDGYIQTQGCFGIHDLHMQALLLQLQQLAGSVSAAKRQGIDVIFYAS